ncbi:chloride channel protein [Alphaproteobacteria bacterium LSUCC0684]
MSPSSSGHLMPASRLAPFFALLVGIGVAFGIMMAIVTNGFVLGVRSLTSIRENMGFLDFTLGGAELSLAPLLAILIAAMAILVIRKVFGITRWHGPADSIYAAHRTDNELDVKAGMGSTLAAFVSASGGASVGQYGPLVHFGATIGSFLRQVTGNRLTTDIFIGCGVAGAIAAGFNAPIAGVVFAHEAILRHFSVRAVTPIAIASITSAGISKWIFSDSHAFAVVPPISLVETLPVALVAGPVFGIIAVLYMMAIRRSAQLAGRSGYSPAVLLLIAAVLTGLVGMVLPEILGLGTGAVLDMLNMKLALAMLLVIMVAKTVMTALCIGFGLFGGLFSPALFVGAAAGGSLHQLLGAIGITAGGPVMVVCGMAAVAGAVIGAPVSAILIMLEMTMSYNYALASMLSVVTAALISQYLYGHSFFDRQLLDRGIDIAQGRGHLEMMELSVETIVDREFLAARPDETKDAILPRMIEQGVSEGYVIDGSRYGGKFTLKQLIPLSGGERIASVADLEAISIKHDASLMQAIEIASDFVGESIPVLNRETGEMIGIVTEGDIFQLYLKTQYTIMDLEHS